MRKKILVIDDDSSLVKLVGYALIRQGYEVYEAYDGQEGLRQVDSHQPDLVILDIMMPKMDGWQVCRRIRETSDVPIIMLTAKAREEDIVRGLEAGADDYLTKPFGVKELLARVRAVLRRAALPPPKPVTYSDEYLMVDLKERRVVVNGESVKLTPTEFRLLAQLVENAGRVLTYRQLLEKVWGWEYMDDVDYVRIYVWRLRRRIEQEPSDPHYILTEYGVGYRFERLVRRGVNRSTVAKTAPAPRYAVSLRPSASSRRSSAVAEGATVALGEAPYSHGAVGRLTPGSTSTLSAVN